MKWSISASSDGQWFEKHTFHITDRLVMWKLNISLFCKFRQMHFNTQIGVWNYKNIFVSTYITTGLMKISLQSIMVCGILKDLLWVFGSLGEKRGSKWNINSLTFPSEEWKVGFRCSLSTNHRQADQGTNGGQAGNLGGRPQDTEEIVSAICCCPCL